MQVANSLQFGDLRCYMDHKVHLHNVTNDVCMDIKTQVRRIMIFGSVRSSRNANFSLSFSQKGSDILWTSMNLSKALLQAIYSISSDKRTGEN